MRKRSVALKKILDTIELLVYICKFAQDDIFARRRKLMTSMITNQTNWCLRSNGTTAAIWQRCAHRSSVANCLSSLPLDAFMVGGNLQGQPQAIEKSAIKDRYLKI